MVNKVTYMVFEILEKAAMAKTRADKIAVLQQHKECWALRDILRGSFDDSLDFNLPQ